jgi:hypothetical protein
VCGSCANAASSAAILAAELAGGVLPVVPEDDELLEPEDEPEEELLDDEELLELDVELLELDVELLVELGIVEVDDPEPPQADRRIDRETIPNENFEAAETFLRVRALRNWAGTICFIELHFRWISEWWFRMTLRLILLMHSQLDLGVT